MRRAAGRGRWRAGGWGARRGEVGEGKKGRGRWGLTRRLGDTWRGGDFTVRHAKMEERRHITGRDLKGGRRQEDGRWRADRWERQWEAGESEERQHRESGRGERRARDRQDR